MVQDMSYISRKQTPEYEDFLSPLKLLFSFRNKSSDSNAFFGNTKFEKLGELFNFSRRHFHFPLYNFFVKNRNYGKTQKSRYDLPKGQCCTLNAQIWTNSTFWHYPGPNQAKFRFFSFFYFLVTFTKKSPPKPPIIYILCNF